MHDLHYYCLTSDSLPASFEPGLWKKLVEQEPDFEQISLVILGRDAMRSLNQNYHDGVISTDLLTFTLSPGSGDMFICPKNVEFFSKRHHIPFDVRWWHLLAHGLSHLKDYDHQHFDQAQLFFPDERSRWARWGQIIPYLQYWSWDNQYVYDYQRS